MIVRLLKPHFMNHGSVGNLGYQQRCSTQAATKSHHFCQDRVLKSALWFTVFFDFMFKFIRWKY